MVRNIECQVLIAVAGTVHKNKACLGIFENLFCLLRDPGMLLKDNNNEFPSNKFFKIGVDFKWRIRWAELRITQMMVHQMPGVSDLPDLKKAVYE